MGSGFLNSNSFSSLSYSTWAPANNTAIPTNSWWKDEKFDLSMISNVDNSRVRFVLIDTDNNGARGNYGWLIDDIKITSPGIRRPYTYLFEDFNNGIPSTWTNSALSGSFDWMHGTMFDVSDNLVARLDNTSMIYFNDDSLGSTHINNTVELLTPLLSPVPNVPLFLEFEYNFRDLKSVSDHFEVEIFDGNNWIPILNIVNDDCGRWGSVCSGSYPKAKIDITDHINDQLQVKFTYHDGNDWAYWAAFDNVHIYSPDSYYPIGTINTVDAMGVADSMFVKTWTSGSVAGVDLKRNNGYSFTLIDFAGLQEGISVYSPDDINNYVVNEGDSLLIYGLVEQVNGLQQFVADTILLLAANKNLPSPRKVFTLDESSESQLLLLNDVSVVSMDSTAAGFFVGLETMTDTVLMKIEPATDVDDQISFKLGDFFCGIKGIGMQADSSSPLLNGYYIVPMRASDLSHPIDIDLGNDTIVCSSSSHILDAGAGFETYLWNTGDTTRTIQVDQTTDSLYVVIANSSLGCHAVDSIIVEVDVCAGIVETIDMMDIKIYPNPSKGLFYIEAPDSQSNLEIQLLDQQGKPIDISLIGTIGNRKQVDVSQLPKGMYFFKFQSEENVSFKKVVLF